MMLQIKQGIKTILEGRGHTTRLELLEDLGVLTPPLFTEV